jgi:hypothetical protein
VAGIDAAADRAGIADVAFVAAGDPADTDTFDALHDAAAGRVAGLAEAPEPDASTACRCWGRPADPAARHWCPARYTHMAAVRNRLLGVVRELAPGVYASIDSDVVLHPDAIVEMFRLLELGFDAAGTRVYLSPPGPRADQRRNVPNYAFFGRAGVGLHRPDATGSFKVDVLFAVKLMSPAAFAVDYQHDHNGEDVGWAKACRTARVRLGWSGRVTSKHAMTPDHLAAIDPRVGW